MQLVVTSLLTGSQVEYIREFNRSIKAGDVITTSQFIPADLPSMTGLWALEAANKLTVAITYTAAEKKNIIPPDSLQTQDMMPVLAADLDSLTGTIRKPLVAGMAGAADDVTIYAVNTLPFKMRIIDAWIYVAAGDAMGRKVDVRSAAMGGGTLAASVDAALGGRQGMLAAFLATVVLTPGAMVGLFARRSHDAIAGELYLRYRRES